MKKAAFIPLEKQSKKAQREYYTKQRGSWDGVVPVTKVIPNRKKTQQTCQTQQSYAFDD